MLPKSSTKNTQDESYPLPKPTYCEEIAVFIACLNSSYLL